MQASSRALFHAVVVMGAGLVACRSASPRDAAAEHGVELEEGAQAPRDEDPEGTAAAPAAIADPIHAVEEPTGGPAGVALEDARGSTSLAVVDEHADTTGDADPGDSDRTSADTTENKKATKRPTTRPRESQRCPKGSEMPYPPCFYIL